MAISAAVLPLAAPAAAAVPTQSAASPEELAATHPTVAASAYMQTDRESTDSGKPQDLSAPSERRLARAEALSSLGVGREALGAVETSATLNCRALAPAVTSHPDVFYDGTACGTFASINGEHFGPASVPAGSHSRSAAWTNTSGPTVTGAGSGADPFVTTTNVSAGATGVELTQRDRWVAGSSSWTTAVEIRNTTGTTQELNLYRGADCYVDGSDNGGGIGRGTNNSAVCVGAGLEFSVTDATSAPSPNDGTVGAVRRYVAGYYEIWSAVGSGSDLPNTWLGNQIVDNGLALQWPVSVKAGRSVTVQFLSELRAPSVPLNQLPGLGTPGVASAFGVSTTAAAGDPVDTATGAFHTTRTDALLPAAGVPLSVSRSYSSRREGSGVFGRGWVSPWDSRVTIEQDGSASVQAADGSVQRFQRNGSEWQAPAGGRATLTSLPNGHEMRDFTNTVWTFDSDGLLIAISDLSGVGLTIDRDVDGKISMVSDEAGRQALPTYSGDRIAAIEMPGYRTITYAYDGEQLTRVTSPGGRTQGYEWSDGRIVATSHGSSTKISQTYDGQGRVLTQDIAGVGSYTFDYQPVEGGTLDQGGLTTTVINPEGLSTSYTYSGFVLREMVEPGDRRTTYTWDSDLNLTEVVAPNGATTQHTYNRAGDLIETRAPDGSLFIAAYNANHQPVTTVLSGGSSDWLTSYEYDEAGNLVSSWNEAGGQTRYTYDSRNRLTGRTTPAGGVTRFTYDDASDLVSTVEDPLGRTRTVTNDAGRGLPLEILSAGGSRTAFEYDDDGNLTALIDPNGARTTYTYDVFDQRSSVTDPRGNTTRFRYRMDGALAAISRPDGTVVNQEHDSEGRLREQVLGTSVDDDSLGRKATWQFGTNALPTGRTSNQGSSQTLETDSMGHVVRTTDSATGPGLGVQNAVFDLAGRVTERSFSDTTEPLAMQFDPAGLPTSISTGGVSSQIAYSPTGHPVATSVTEPEQTRTYRDAWDADGRLVRRQYPDGTEVEYVRDAAGQITTIRVDGSEQASYTYDANGNVTSVNYANGVRQSRVYDPADRVLKISVTRGSEVISEDVITRSPDGLVTRLQQVRLGMDDRTQHFRYDVMGRISRTCGDAECATVLARYDYDESGNITRLMEKGRRTDYVYAPGSDRMVSASAYKLTPLPGTEGTPGTPGTDAIPGTPDRVEDSSTTTSVLTGICVKAKKKGRTSGKQGCFKVVRCDKKGKVLTCVKTKAQARRYKPAKARPYETKRALKCDLRKFRCTKQTGLKTVPSTRVIPGAPGRPAVPGTPGRPGTPASTRWDLVEQIKYDLDGRGRVVKAGNRQFTWDMRDRLTSISVSGRSTQLSYDGLGNPVSVTGGESTRSYLWEQTGPLPRPVSETVNGVTSDYISGPLGVEMVNSGADTASLATDLLGSISGFTDAAGDTLRTWHYEAYGTRTEWAAATSDLPPMSLGYTAEVQLGDVVHLRARSLDTGTGRFLSNDPAYPLTHEGYAYAEGNPYALVDPSGQWPTVAIGAIVGAVSGAVVSGAVYAVSSGGNFQAGQFLGAVGGGAAGGAITGACLGTGAGLLASGACGAAGGAVGNVIQQSFDGRRGYDVSELAISTAAGGATSMIGARLTSRVWNASDAQRQNAMRFTNQQNGGIANRNLLPWNTSGRIGSWMHEQNAYGSALSFGSELLRGGGRAS